MPELETKSEDATAWTRENPPPEDVTVRLAYAAATPRAFHFRRTLLAYDHYLKALYDNPDGGPGPVTVATSFLVDTVAAAERDDLAAFLATDAGQALLLSLYRAANALLDIYNGTLTIEIVQPGEAA